MQEKNKATAASIIFSVVLLALGLSAHFIETKGGEFFPIDPGIVGNVVILSIFILVVPRFLLSYRGFREIREIEEKYPDFLRDVVEALRSGMPLHQAIMHTSKFEYGRLSHEIKKMAVQLSWGMSLDKVIEQFIQRIKRSKRIFLATQVMLESYHSGGDVVSTLEGIAESISTLFDADKEKKSLLNPYTTLMYIIVYLFLAIVVIFNRLMIPIFTSTQQLSGGLSGFGFTFQNPCENQVGFGDVVCSGYKYVCTAFNLDTASIGCYYSALFIVMTTVIGVFSGLIAGEITEGDMAAGTKHSVLMAGTIVGAFFIMARLGILTGV